jgi:hypothetical protein
MMLSTVVSTDSITRLSAEAVRSLVSVAASRPLRWVARSFRRLVGVVRGVGGRGGRE